MKSIVRYFLERLGYHVFKREHLPYGYIHQLDIARFSAEGREVQCVFDVGANVGQSASAYALEFPSAQIHSFEPVRSTFEELEKASVRHPGITPHNMALGSSRGEAVIYLTDCSLTNTLVSREGEGARTEEILVETVDSFCETHSIDVIDLLKTDAEGFDLEVLRGASRMLSAGIRYVVVEVTFNPDDHLHTSFYEVADFLEGFGFGFVAVYDHDFNSFNPPRAPLSYGNAMFYRSLSE